MKQLIGRSCRLTVFLNGKSLFYTAKTVLEVSDTHITFIDKFNERYSYRLQDVIQIQDIK